MNMPENATMKIAYHPLACAPRGRIIYGAPPDDNDLEDPFLNPQEHFEDPEEEEVFQAQVEAFYERQLNENDLELHPYGAYEDAPFYEDDFTEHLTHQWYHDFDQPEEDPENIDHLLALEEFLAMPAPEHFPNEAAQRLWEEEGEKAQILLEKEEDYCWACIEQYEMEQEMGADRLNDETREGQVDGKR